jgi:hypothetical protein
MIFVEYRLPLSPDWTITLMSGGYSWRYQGNGAPPISGNLYSEFATPPAPTNIPFRLCALGVTTPKEYTITISGLQLCYIDVMVTGVVMSTVDSIVSGSLNGTWTLPVAFNRTTGCGGYSAEIAVIKFVNSYTGCSFVGHVYLQVSPSGSGGMLMYIQFFRNEVEQCFTHDWMFSPVMTYGLFSFATPSDGLCDSTHNLQNTMTDCIGWNFSMTKNGTATVTPIHDDNWSPS